MGHKMKNKNFEIPNRSYLIKCYVSINDENREAIKTAIDYYQFNRRYEITPSTAYVRFDNFADMHFGTIEVLETYTKGYNEIFYAKGKFYTNNPNVKKMKNLDERRILITAIDYTFPVTEKTCNVAIWKKRYNGYNDISLVYSNGRTVPLNIMNAEKFLNLLTYDYEKSLSKAKRFYIRNLITEIRNTYICQDMIELKRQEFINVFDYINSLSYEQYQFIKNKNLKLFRTMFSENSCPIEYCNVSGEFFDAKVFRSAYFVDELGNECIFNRTTNNCDILATMGYTQCENCKKWIYGELPEYEFTGSEMYCICDDCKDTLYTCAECGLCVFEDDIQSHGRDNYCQDCFDELFFCCDNCNEFHLREDMIGLTDGNSICISCYDYEYTTCEECGRVIHNDNAYNDEEGERYLCRNCFEEREQIIECYHHTKKPELYEMINGKQIISYDKYNKREKIGIELEVDNGCNAVQTATNIKNIFEKFLIFKRDGSLSSNGFEIVTQTMTETYFKKCFKKQFKKIIKETRNNGYTSHKAGNCGLHIHYNIKHISTLTLYKLFSFFDENRETIAKLSRRRDFGYCRQIYLDKYAIIRYAKTKATNEHGSALHISPYGTLECRIFRGTLKQETFIASVDFYLSLIKYCKETSLSTFNDFDNFKQFINGRKNEHRELIAYIESKGM